MRAPTTLTAPAPFNEDGSNDPNSPTKLGMGSSDTTIWIEGAVSAADPDYFYIPIPSGTALSAITLQSYQSIDAIAFFALQEGAIFSAGADITQMLAGRRRLPCRVDSLKVDISALTTLGRYARGFWGSLPPVFFHNYKNKGPIWLVSRAYKLMENDFKMI